MNQLISTASRSLYRHAAKPILFTMPPDTAHERMLRGAERAGRSRVLTGIMHAGWAYDNPALLGQTLHDSTFNNPIGLSAGLDKNFQLPPVAKAIGFGFMEGGTVTWHASSGNPRPWFYRAPRSRSLVVHAGLANQGMEAVLRRIRQYDTRVEGDFPLNLSVGATNGSQVQTLADALDDYRHSLYAIYRAPGIAMVTLNISCPNTRAGEPFTQVPALEQLLKIVDEIRLSQPVFIKMPNQLPWPEVRELLETAARHRIAGITLSNLAKDRRLINPADRLPEGVPGGLSGKPTWEASNALLREAYRAYHERFTFIGVGGVFSVQDAYTKIRLGASLVELVTGLIFEGPQLIGQINRGLARQLRRDGFSNIREAVGSAH